MQTLSTIQDIGIESEEYLMPELIMLGEETSNKIEYAIHYFLNKAKTDPDIQSLALQITDGSDDKIRSIYDFLRTNLRYVTDHANVDFFVSPIFLVKKYTKGLAIRGDCEEFAMMAVALATAVGMKARVVIVAQTPEGYDHAIAEIWSDKLQRYVQVDASTGNVPLGWQTTYIMSMPIETDKPLENIAYSRKVIPEPGEYLNGT